jgi:hypothetical protein
VKIHRQPFICRQSTADAIRAGALPTRRTFGSCRCGCLFEIDPKVDKTLGGPYLRFDAGHPISTWDARCPSCGRQVRTGAAPEPIGIYRGKPIWDGDEWRRILVHERMPAGDTLTPLDLLTLYPR